MEAPVIARLANCQHILQEHSHGCHGIVKVLTSIDGTTSGASSSYPHGIDSAGDVVYSWTHSAGLFHGALRTGGKIYKFDAPKGTNRTYADGINDHRLVVGVYHTKGGATAEGFKATY